MNNDETRLINDETMNNETPVNSAPEKKTSKVNMAAGAASGFVAGAAAGATVQALGSEKEAQAENAEDGRDAENMLSENQENEQQIANEQADTSDSESAPNNDVHVHVHHHIAQDAPHASSDYTMVEEVYPQDMEAEAILISEEPTHNDVRVLGVPAVQLEDGSIMNVALLENEGDHALMVDVDNDGMIEVFVHDDNSNGYIEDHEIHDISHAEITVDELKMQQEIQESEYFTTSDDDMPDYINDADLTIEI